MSDTVLFLTGVAVFGMMLVAIIMTVVEFQEINKKKHSKTKAPD
jgi:hypothetical protein